MATAAHAMPKGVALYLVPGDVQMRSVADIRFFLAGVEGMSGDAAERAVLPFPSHEIDPYARLDASRQRGRARARVLPRARHRIHARGRRVGRSASSARERSRPAARR